MNNSSQHFDKVTICLHWGMALLIFFLFGLGLYMVDLSYYDPWYRDSTALHKSIGVGVFVLLVFRVLWRIFYVNKHVRAVASKELKAVERKLALMMHVLLYMLMATICISGYMVSTAGGRELALQRYVARYDRDPALDTTNAGRVGAEPACHRVDPHAGRKLASAPRDPCR